jgi:large subunit ribosomal protein L17
MTSLVLHEAITTTEARAKEVAPRFERLVTHAKKGTLAGGRKLRSELLTEAAVQKLLQEITPTFKERHGGYTRIIKLANRRGDNAPMVRLSIVLDDAVAATTAKTPSQSKPKTAAQKPAAQAEITAAAEGDKS